MTKATANPLFHNKEYLKFNWQKISSYDAEQYFRTKSKTEARDEFGNTPLHYAAYWSHNAGVVDNLIHTKGGNADQKARNENGDTPLHLAVYNKIYDSAGILAEDRSVNHQKPAIKTLKRFLDALEAKNKDGYTPLLLAIKKGKTNLALFLIRHGADVNTEGKGGKTPLLLAIQEDAAEVVAELLENQATVNDDVLKAGKSVFFTSKADTYWLLNDAFYNQKDISKNG